jgi:hypothetical protein
MMNRVDKIISSEQSTRPIFSSGCDRPSLCDASFEISLQDKSTHIKGQVNIFTAGAMFLICCEFDEPLSCTLRSKIFLPIQIGDVGNLGSVECVISDTQVGEDGLGGFG